MKHFPGDQYDLKPEEATGGVVNDQPSKCNTAGAMTKSQQIKRLMAQGQVNRAWANGMFPGEGDIPAEFIPPDYAPDTMSLIDEQRAVLRGHKENQAKKIAADKKAAREAADEQKAAEAAADKDTTDNIERAPKVP